MLNKSLEKEHSQGFPSSLYYLWSGEALFLEEAQALISSTVLAGAPADFNHDVYDGTLSDGNDIVDAASTLPVMSRRRLVVVREVHQLSASAIKVLSRYLSNPSESTCLLLLSGKAPKKAMKYSGPVISLDIREWEVPAWLKRAAAAKGLALTGDAVDCLIECVGHDVGMLSMELEKLALSGKKTISGKDVAESTSMMRKYTSFDLLDALVGGQRGRAFRILKTMLSGNAFDAPVILGTLNWHFRQFYSLWRAKGKKPFKMREKTFQALKKYLPRISEDDFCSIFQSLHEADLGIKTTGRPELVLELLLIRLLQKGTVN